MFKTIPLSALWLLAFLSGLYFVNAWQMELFASAFLILVLFTCFMLSRDAVEGWEVPKAPIFLFLGLFWLLMLVSITWSGVPYVSVIGFCLSSVLPLTFFAFVLSGRDEDFILVARVVPAILAGLAVWALIQYYAFNIEFDGQAKHPLANPNSLAALFNIGLFPALGVMVSARNKTLSTGALIFAILLFGGMTATTSRAALIFGGLTLILFVALNPSIIKAHWKCLGIFIAACAGLYFATSLGVQEHTQLTGRMEKFVTTDDAYVLTGNRNNLWAGVWALIQDHWIFGTGIGTFFLHYPGYRVPQETTGAYLAHSDPMQFWSEIGIGGVVLFYAIGVAFLMRTVRAVSKLEKGSDARIRLMSVVAAIFVTILHAHFTFNLYVVPVLFLTGFLLAWWMRETQSILQTPTRHYAFPSQVPATYRAGFIVIPLVMLAALFASFIASEIYIKKAKAAAYDNNMEAFTRYVNLSDQLSFQMNYRSYLLAVTVPISILEVNRQLMSADEQKTVYDQANSFLDAAEGLNPVNPAVPYYRAFMRDFVDAEIVADNAPTQEALYQLSLARNPLHIGSRLALLKLYRDQNDMERFEAVLESGLRWKYLSPKAQELYLEAQRYYILTKQFVKFRDAEARMAELQKRLSAASRRSRSPMSQRLFTDGDTL